MIETEHAKLARLLAVAVAIIVYATGASQGDLWNLGIAFAVAVVASVGIWLQPKSDLGDWQKLLDHLTLSVPLAGLSVVGGLVLYDNTLQFTAIFGLFIGLLTTASVLEQRLMETP